MNDSLNRAEAAILKLAEENAKTAENVRRLAEKVEALADGQKHSDAKLDALTDLVRDWYERNGNGHSGAKPS